MLATVPTIAALWGHGTSAEQAPTSLWGYVASIEAQALVLLGWGAFR